MPSQSITATVTRKSNGAIEIMPSEAGAFPKLPEMGDEITLTIEVTKTAAEIEKSVAKHKAERLIPPEAAVAKKK